MLLNKKGDLKYYTFENIGNIKEVKHCFSTKFGGVSTGFYESMNLHFRDDKKENVIKNYEIICSAIGLDYKNTVFSNQVHSDKVYKVTKDDIGKGLLKESDIKGYDALITNEKDIVLVTFYADCVPIFIVDNVNKAIGIAHSGWRGTVKEIGAKTVNKMVKEYGSNPKDLIIGIGPSIEKCCFQVGEEVVNEFRQNLSFSNKYIFDDENCKNKYKIDLQKIIKQTIINSGVLEKNIEISKLCTMCNKDIFFSHRAMGNERGSLAGIISFQ
ncbi:peptidoglycan editing factor PgeF [[Clostridium] colinum]|uniref:peptidoglycan editing factor PgeF n=1 Tax=[Clostridium] colinum TaxID=36835 RepID=UPI002023FF9F|nr:peptidoglycan editing factor PgeF [[Clostridium] colinum]